MVSQSSINNTIQDNNFSVNRVDPLAAGTTVQSSVNHADNTSGTSNAKFFSQVGGTSGGDPHVNFNVAGTQDYSMGIDNSDSDNLKINNGADPSTGSTYATFDQATQNVWFDGISFDGGTNVLSTFVDASSFTPALEFGGASVGPITYAQQAGRYSRIGNVVFFRILLVLTSKGTSIGNATIEGLPVTVVAGGGASSATSWGLINLSANYTAVRASASGVASNILINENGDNVSQSPLTDAAFADDSRIFISGIYFAA